MDANEKPEVSGSPGEKAKAVLGEKLNRPSKEPPPLPGSEGDQVTPPARRPEDEVRDL